ncbi:MAG: hypothetical protein EBX40_02785 [Gammaproteobacteria bacterium]|nr:hypothetical protein [Gammaproteobacteria bacterium]
MSIDADIRQELWNEKDSERFSNDAYNHLLIEQYKIYIEMYDRVSARRTLANTFFLTLHAIFISALGISLHNPGTIAQAGLLIFPLLGLLVLCYAWSRLVQYFRRVINAKEKVINEFEKRLPSNPSFLAERRAMSTDRPYNSLRRMEITLPYVFGALYVLSYLYILIAR